MMHIILHNLLKYISIYHVYYILNNCIPNISVVIISF